MNRKAIPEIVKKRLFQEANSKCPLCGESEIATLQIHHIQAIKDGGKDDERNLIVLCSNCHSKATADEIAETKILRLKISLMNSGASHTNKRRVGDVINFEGGTNSGVVANKVEIKTQNKKVKISPPLGSIAFKTNHKNYIKHLIDRYHDFKKTDIGKTKMNYSILYGAIKREFGAKWDMIPLDKFHELSIYLQSRIDNTIFGKNQKAKNVKRYSTFEEYIEKYNG